jgi:altronate hydrolase
MMGAEKYLMDRMDSADTIRKFAAGLEYYTTLARKLGVSLSGNFVPGNRDGGLINPSVKSLGAVQKGGTSAVRDCLDYAERIKKRGLNIMTGPGNDPESLTGMAASGANIFLFSTGMGATEGHITVPSVRITSRSEVFRRLRGDMDFDAGRLAGGLVSLDDMAAELMDMTVKVASGKKTRSEMLKKRSFQVWSAGKLSL